MRVLITGGYGCIGSWIAKVLTDANHDVYIYDLKQDLHRMELLMDAPQLSKVGYVAGDVTDLNGLLQALKNHEITHVLHLAGLQVPVCRANPILGAQVNVIGTLAVFEAVRQLGGQIGRVVYASSAAVFSPPSAYPDGPIADDVLLTPNTHYGVFKCCNEGNARVYFQDHSITSIGLRPWTVYGVGRDFGMTSEPTKAIKSLALNRPYHISYGGLQDFQFVEDVAKMFVQCLSADYTGSKSYNVRGDVVDLAAFHRTLCEVEPTAKELVTFGENQLPIAFDLDDGALQQEVGPVVKTPLVEGVRQTLAHFRRLHDEGRLDDTDLK